MRLAIVGAGATGGFLGAKLSRAGADVVLIARGEHLAAMRERGITVQGPEERFTARPECTDDLAVLAGADAAVLTLKAHSLPGLAGRLGSALGPRTAVVTAQNGIPWWYFHEAGGQFAGRRIESVDPGGIISAAVPADRIVGCVVYPATRLVAPGVVEHIEGNRFSIGEPDGSRSERCRGIAAAFTAAGLRCPVQPRLREEIWLKLLGNATLNPISAVARATLGEIMDLDESRALVRTLMEEVESVARGLAIEIPLTLDKRLAGAAAAGAHRSSMLQDVEAGRPLEVEALVGSVVELGDLLGLPLPALRAVYACVKLLDRTSGR